MQEAGFFYLPADGSGNSVPLLFGRKRSRAESLEPSAGRLKKHVLHDQKRSSSVEAFSTDRGPEILSSLVSTPSQPSGTSLLTRCETTVLDSHTVPEVPDILGSGLPEDANGIADLALRRDECARTSSEYHSGKENETMNYMPESRISLDPAEYRETGKQPRQNSQQDSTETSCGPPDEIGSGADSGSWEQRMRQIRILSAEASRLADEQRHHVLASQHLEQRLNRSEKTYGELIRESLELHRALETRRKQIKEEKLDLERERASARAKSDRIRETVAKIKSLAAPTDTILVKHES